MSKAVFIDANGGSDVLTLRERTLGPPAPGEVQMANTAIGLNFIDIYQRRGLYPVSIPAVLGSEAAGVVEAVGEGVDRFKPGDRVAYICGGGAYAEKTNINAGMCAAIPDDVSDEIAAAVFLKGLTAEMLVNQVFPLNADHSCLIHAAAGGVGTLLCQWAAHIGARVIGVVGNAAKVDIAQANGAQEIIIRTETDSIAKEVRRITQGRGVDVVYDSVGEATFESSLNSLAMRGHMVTYGNASGPVPAIQPLELGRRGSLTLTRPTLFHYATPDRLPAMAATLFDMVARGALVPKVGARFALKNIAQAHDALESGQTTGSIVVTP